MSPSGIDKDQRYKPCKRCGKNTPAANETGLCQECRAKVRVTLKCPTCHGPRIVTMEYLRHPANRLRECAACSNLRKNAAIAVAKRAAKAERLENPPPKSIRVNNCWIRPTSKLQRQADGTFAPRCRFNQPCLRGIHFDIFGFPSCSELAEKTWPSCPGFTATGTPDMPTPDQERLLREVLIAEQSARPSCQSLCLE
jgi:hypothetical protein